jgi:hypothetical protein
MITKEQITALGDYEHLRELPDGTIAGIGRLMFTTALYIDLNEWGWERRFCFTERGKALEELAKLNSCEDLPEGWVARRGR